MQLSPLKQCLVLYFDEVGSRWGINRIIRQTYALFYAAHEPINTDEIVESLGFPRSNVSIGFKELESWKLMRLSHKPGTIPCTYLRAHETIEAV